MCEQQGYLKCDCGGNCNGDGGALDHIKELKDELATWRSVFPDVAPEQVQPDRSEMRDRINELTKQRDALARRCGELEMKYNNAKWIIDELKQQENDLNALLVGYRDSLRDGKISKVVASITTILIR